MEKEFVTYELALRMKALGFDEPCMGNYFHTKELQTYGGDISKIKNSEFGSVTAPTWQSAFEWFLKEYQLHCTITSISQESWQWHITKPGESLGKLYDEDFYTPEEAQQACLEKLCEIVEQKQKENEK